MIRRDYILRMIQEFCEILNRINSLKQAEQWRLAGETLDQQFDRLLGVKAQEAGKLTESELLARLIQNEPTWTVRDKTLMLATLLKEAGDLAVAEDRQADGCRQYLQGLHLLLSVSVRGEGSDWPEFVPGVEVFVIALGDSPLPAQTRALLMQHYEQTGEFAKAEDALFELIEMEPGHLDSINFGIAFYERVREQSDAKLDAGKLPRTELEAGLADLRGRKASSNSH
jgi:hypothetical protein